jgi:hypothetical protein
MEMEVAVAEEGGFYHNCLLKEKLDCKYQNK